VLPPGNTASTNRIIGKLEVRFQRTLPAGIALMSPRINMSCTLFTWEGMGIPSARPVGR